MAVIMPQRYDASSLIDFAGRLLVAAGLAPEMSKVTAEILVEGDLLGHSTHGLALLPLYLDEVREGRMSSQGAPRVLADFPAALTWDGMRLPGPWLTSRAIGIALDRAKTLGTATVVIRRSHHIACLASYLRQVAEQGMMIVLACSDPTVSWMAPYGGKKGVISPNPIAAGWPTDKGPVMVDVSQSVVAFGVARRAHVEGRRLPHVWILDSNGNPTDDPGSLMDGKGGTLLPAGGVDHGHKGYALGLLVEALTGSLAGHGRADPGEGWTGTVYVQVLNPALYAGEAAFVRESSWVADACRASPPRGGFERVRLPGEAGLRRREAQLREGVELHASIMPALAECSRKLGIEMVRARVG
jgi:L-lactate dehydrogenase